MSLEKKLMIGVIMRKLKLENLFKNKDPSSDKTSKYYFYYQGRGLTNDLTNHGLMEHYFYSNSFFGLIKKLFKYKNYQSYWDFIHFVYEKTEFNEKQLLKFKSTRYLFHIRHQYDCEKWAKLLVIDLYNNDVISPFIYKHSNVNGMSFGLENFYFRGYNENSLLDSFYYHIKRISNYMPGYDMAVRRKSKRDFLNHFYRICIDYFGMGFDPNQFDKPRFLSSENLFIEDTTQIDALQNSRYYKRRVLVA